MFTKAQPQEYHERIPLVHDEELNTSAETWQKILAHGFRDLRELLNFLELTPEQLHSVLGFCEETVINLAKGNPFPLRVPKPFAERIRKKDPLDPLLRQVLPLPEETLIQNGFVQDPLAEANSIKGRGLLQKYQGRLLVVAHGSCAVHCRYCFRRHFPYDDQHLPPQHWHQLSSFLKAEPSINEIILSGGDPLTLKNQQLEYLTPILETHSQIKRVRIHTRFPIMIPQRIDAGFLNWIQTLSVPIIIVLHINHANEIDQQVANALSRLKNSGATLLNQSVLLKGVNDSVTAQHTLQERLMEVGVLPYYLHLLDSVSGASHFDVPLKKAQEIMSTLQSQLPGYLVPRLVKEIPGEPAKTLIPI